MAGRKEASELGLSGGAGGGADVGGRDGAEAPL